MALNDTSTKILNMRAAKFKNNSPFTLGLLGDSHIGQSNCTTNPTWYRELLKKIVSKNVYTIIHGGDASDHGGASLKQFVNITENQLKYGTINASRTPIFVNIGNHDYLRGKTTKAVSRNDYTKDIGQHNNIIKLFDSNKGPRVAVVLLDTGFTISGKLPSGEDYSKVLKSIEDKMIDLIKKHNTIRFIIDMHVPPQILATTKNDKKFNSSHVLSTQFNSKFRKFIKDFTSRYPGRIIAITAHHKHGWVQKNAYYFSYKTYDMKTHKIPIYLTAQGGHCDGNVQNAQYSFYIISFATFKKNKKRYYKITNVNRFNVTYNVANNVYKLSNPIPIGK
ncbi:metallophosphoesterase [Acetivibrio cellulolyticus]|uniref:metallophosphoesterase n=1 Tax=Acetivibrio cellulolyticus TaxID=35830 RepID=UPI0001E2FBCA|nr:metallophosphoesterase [Acetivibrio cellulolyticus]